MLTKERLGLSDATPSCAAKAAAAVELWSWVVAAWAWSWERVLKSLELSEKDSPDEPFM